LANKYDLHPDEDKDGLLIIGIPIALCIVGLIYWLL